MSDTLPPEPASSESVVTADVAETESRSSDASEARESSGWHNLFGLLPGKKPTADTAAEGTSKDGTSGTTAPSTLTLTQNELDRRVQAETDRREAKRQRESTEREARERQEQIERKLDPKSPEYDPYGGTEERDKLKAEEAAASGFTEFIGNIGKQHDAATLDQLVGALPVSERDRIFKLEGAGVGLDGRKLIVAEGLKALEKHWKAEGAREAEAKLKGDPIFRKRVFSEHRGDVEEPELVVGSPARSGDFMDQVFSDYQAAKGHRNGRRRSSE